MEQENAVNPIPPVILVLFLILAGIEGVLSAAEAGMIGGIEAVGWRMHALQETAFPPLVWNFVWAEGSLDPTLLVRFVSYPFVHDTVMQTLFAAVMLLALGKFVGEAFSSLAVAVVLIVATIAGAVVYGATQGGMRPLIGAFPPVYGLIGAFTYLMWHRLGQLGRNQLAAFRMIGFILAIQLVFGVIFGANPYWVAEVAGFVGGFAISPFVAPGGWRAFVTRLRSR